MNEEKEEGREQACPPKSQKRLQFLKQEAAKGNFLNKADENDDIDPDIEGVSKMKMLSLKDMSIYICNEKVEDGETNPYLPFFERGGKLEIAPRIRLLNRVDIAKNWDGPHQQFGEPVQIG